MGIKFTKETSLDLSNKLNFLEDLSELFEQYSFGKGLDIVYICLNSVDPEIGICRDFETGLVIEKKYIRSKRILEFSYKLNYKQTIEAQTRKEVLTIILDGFKKTYSEIKSLNIKDFDIDRFYSVAASTIEDFAKQDISKEKFFVAQPEEKRELPQIAIMKEAIFWEIIEQSKEERKDFEHQTEIIINKLSCLPENEIIGFEFTFREILAKSAHYNILAAIKIIEGYMNDDSFLYFRCRLIAEGKDFYLKAIENPDYIADAYEIESGGEEMLVIADQAFKKKFGEETEKELPRDVAFNYMNYDEGEEVKGEYWKEEELPLKYPKLWGKYKKESLA